MSSKWVEQLPSTSGIKDPDVRAYLEAFTNAWNLRNGNVGANDSERFVTKGEFSDLSAKSFQGYVAGAVGNLPLGVNPGTLPQGGGPWVGDTVGTSIVNSLLYSMLGARIPDIRPPYELLGEVDRILARALSEIKITKNGVTRLTEAGTTFTRDIRVLDTTVGDYNTIIFDGAYTYKDRAETIATIRASIGSANVVAAITAINSVSVGSDSASARAINVLTASLGLAVRTFFGEAAPNGQPVSADLRNAALRKTGDQWFPYNPSGTVGTAGYRAPYTRHYWTGSAWAIGGISSSGDSFGTLQTYSVAGISNESDVRVTNDTANATYLNYMWAAVTGTSATIVDGAITSATGGPAVASNAWANKWTTLQTSVFEPDGVTVRVIKLQQDMLVGTPLNEDGTPDWSQVGFLGAGVQGHNERLDAAYTLRIESGGLVGGFGLLASRVGDEGVKFAFGVRADRFWIADPADVSVEPQEVDLAKVPFAVDGGNVYIRSAFIKDGTITIAKIEDEISSANYNWDNGSPDGTGWAINSQTGNAVFSNVYIRGTSTVGRLNVVGAVEGQGTVPNNGDFTVTHSEGRKVMVTLWTESGGADIPFISAMNDNSFTVRAHFSSGCVVRYRYW